MAKYITGVSKEDIAFATASDEKIINKRFYNIAYNTDKEAWKTYPQFKKICMEFNKALTRVLMPELKQKTLSAIYIKENNINGHLNYREYAFKFILYYNDITHYIYISKIDLYNLVVHIAKKIAVNKIIKFESDTTIRFEDKCFHFTSFVHKINCNKVFPSNNIPNYVMDHYNKYIDSMFNSSYHVEGIIHIRHDN